MYSVKDLYEGLYKRIGIPIVFDYHHFKFNAGGQMNKKRLEMAMSTCKRHPPIVHYSESKAEHQLDESIKPQAHSDIINQLPNTYGKEVDVMVEGKHEETYNHLLRKVMKSKIKTWSIGEGQWKVYSKLGNL